MLTSERNVKKEKKEKDGLFALLSPSIPFATNSQMSSNLRSKYSRPERRASCLLVTVPRNIATAEATDLSVLAARSTPPSRAIVEITGVMISLRMMEAECGANEVMSGKLWINKSPYRKTGSAKVVGRETSVRPPATISRSTTTASCLTVARYSEGITKHCSEPTRRVQIITSADLRAFIKACGCKTEVKT